MANINLSPNMNLPVPVPGIDPGPQYALDIDSCLTILDGHNHSSGSGVQITPDGININVALPMNDNVLAGTAAVNLTPQTLDAAADSVYVKGVDMFFKDGNGNVIQITKSGSVFATSSGITSGTASAAFVGGVLVVQSAPATPANVDGGSFVFRNNVANSKGLTLSPPNAMGADYGLTLPIIPGQTNVMTLDTSGNMGSTTWDQVGQNMMATGANAVANTRTRAVGSTVGVGGVAISASCGSFADSSGSQVPVTNLSVVITTTGRPVSVALIPDGSLPASLGAVNGASLIYFYRDGSIVGAGELFTNFSTEVLTPPLNMIDIVGAGTHTYAIYARTVGSNVLVTNFKLVVYEL